MFWNLKTIFRVAWATAKGMMVTLRYYFTPAITYQFPKERKPIPERFRGVERFFELYPDYLGEFTFVQIGAPSRSHIRRYQELEGEVEAEADRINRRFQTGSWKPIVLIKRQHSHEEILPYYRAASVCL